MQYRTNTMQRRNQSPRKENPSECTIAISDRPILHRYQRLGGAVIHRVRIRSISSLPIATIPMERNDGKNKEDKIKDSV